MERPLRFAMISTFYPPYHFGGDGSYVRGLTHALARQGHHVTVIHDRDAYHMVRGSDEPEPLQEPDGVEVHGLRSRQGSLSCLATHQTGRPVVHGRRIAEILSQGFDVIHYHNISLIGGPGILRQGSGIKIYTAHEHWLVCPTHILWRHNREVCDGRECLRCTLHYRRPPQPWRVGSYLDRCAEHVDAFTTLSQSCADRHREFGFKKPFEVIPTFAPELPDDDPPLDASAERPYFLFAGRLEAVKGLDEIIPLFRDGRCGADLRIAGAGSQEQHLRDLAGDSPFIRFLGHQSSGRLNASYRGARALVVPSLCYEVFPMVVLEAFRQGTPVIARNRGPFPEIIGKSQGGILFDTPDEFVAATRRMGTDDELRGRLSRQAQEALQANWTEEISMARYFELIRELAERATAGAESEVEREVATTF